MAFTSNFKFCNARGIVLQQQSLSSPVQTLIGGDWLLESEYNTISLGCNHSAAVKTDGTLWLWGDGTQGILGNNLTTNQSSPVQTVSATTNWKTVSAGRNVTGAIKTDGTLWMWGRSEEGQLGAGIGTSAGNSSSPIQTIACGTNWKQISTASNLFDTGAAGAIKTDGTLWLWGDNACGLLGINSTTARCSPTQTIAYGSNWKQLSMSNYHTAAVKTDGTLWLWGRNDSPADEGTDPGGQLGNGFGSGTQLSPVQTVSTATNWKQVSVGGYHSAAIKCDGTLWLWGDNEGGELGINSTTRHCSPVQTVSATTNWKQVSLGGGHSAAIKTDGTLWLWGSGGDFRLGNNSNQNNQSSPVQTIFTATNWSQVSLSSRHSGAIKTDGTLWMWGNGSAGKLGNCCTQDRCSPVQTVSTTTNWETDTLEEAYSISAGFTPGGVQAPSAHSAAIKSDGTLWLWGLGRCGILGNNSATTQSSPVQTVSTTTNWKQVSLGADYSAALKTDGTLWLWGEGSNGRLGTNATTDHSSPVQTIACGTNWKQVSLGFNHSAAIKTDGTLWLWGKGGSGEIGDDTNGDELSPVQTIACGTNWKQVSLGFDHSAAIKTDGTLWLWGKNSAGGPLGNNTENDEKSPIQTISCGTNWCQVSLGCEFSAAVKTDGTLWTWGKATCGKLGDGNVNNRLSPVQTICTGTNWKFVSLGCNNAGAIKTDGTLWLWGEGSSGELGNNSTTDRCVPVQTIATGISWSSVDLGEAHTLATTQDSKLYAWGANDIGQAGCFPLVDSCSVDIFDFDDVFIRKEIFSQGGAWGWGAGTCGLLGNNSTTNRSSPVQTVSGGVNWKQVSLGRDSANFQHSAAVKTDGTLWLWGDGACGRLGNNANTAFCSPIQTTSTTTNWKQVSLGCNHSAAIKTDGTLWLWGHGAAGRLGNNSTTDRLLPVQTVSATANWKQVSLGGGHSAAIKTDGTLWLWGCNFFGVGDSGQIGHNSSTQPSSPVQTIACGTNWKQVSLGDYHSAAVKTDGTLWLWGLNSCGFSIFDVRGQLGNNSTTDRSSPVQTIACGTNWKQVSLGSCHSAAIKTDGTLWLWGRNICGRLGDNTSTNRSSPVQTISTGINWKQVSLGDCHSAAIKTDGTLWIWGLGTCGRLGDNSLNTQSSPVQTIVGGTNWIDISLGSLHSFGIREDCY